MAVIELVLTAAGTAIGSAVVIRNRQLSRPRLHVSAGEMECLRARNDLKVKTRSLVYGWSGVSRKDFVPCIHVLHNRGKLPITDLRIDISYPGDCDSGELGHVGRDRIAGRSERHKFGPWIRDVAEVKILRPGEKLFYMLWLRVPRSKAPLANADDEAALIRSRYGSLEGLRAGIPLRCAVWSANCQSETLTTPIFIAEARSLADLSAFFQRVTEAAWDNQRLTQGLYWTPTPWKRSRTRVANAELEFFHSPPGIDKARQADEGSVLTRPDGALITHEVPPWGFFGSSFDLHEYMHLVRLGR